VRAIAADGAVALNADDPRVAGMAGETRARVITYGRAATAEVRAVGDVTEDARGLAFALEIAGRREARLAGLLGRHNVTNALAAASAGVAVGLALPDIVAGLERARPAKGRCVWREVSGVRILDDSYNANPPAMRAAFDTVAAHQGRAASWSCSATCSSWDRWPTQPTSSSVARSRRAAPPSSWGSADT